ncbi:hypothetical protein FB45DRAFT_340074 [Roridomyces roridus]|uniref:INO80 complex subunit B-like conserved region domain-containing protein n=1 Tax=Roridomyces roridus TaxID=1738132 RepID=A0AAD7B4Y7_9AGAR|nr:hypothetical protein FB45DRAFT_340074 [Roridomyces roridus]
MPLPAAGEDSEVEIEVEDVQESSDVEDEDRDGEGEGEEDAGEDELESEAEDEAQSVSHPLKITLKLGAQPEASGSRPSTRRYAPAKNEDIESEDSDSQDPSSDEADSTYGVSKKLTARQAALASAGGDSSPAHVALETGKTSSRKRQLAPDEVALRKEENARKRKNMIEKKLEDEKAETINRLLKKQSRPKNKRTTALNNPPSDVEDAPGEMDVDDQVNGGMGGEADMAAPKMYRWVSTSRSPAATTTEVTMFCVPESLLPPSADVDMDATSVTTDSSRCAVPGCDLARKYRAVGREWGVGACGIGHLRVLAAVV